MAASSIDILSFLNSLAPTSSQSDELLSEYSIFLDFFVRFEELITSGFFPVETWAGLGGSSVEIEKKAYTVPSYVEKIHTALKSCIYIKDSAKFDIAPVLTLANEKINDLKHPSPFYNGPHVLTILFYRKLADILNVSYQHDASQLDSQASLKTSLAALSALLRGLFPVLETMKKLYQTLGEPRMQSQLESVEMALVETPQLSTSLDLRGIYGETEWQAITYLLLFQDKDFQLTEIDATGLTPTTKITEALRIIQHVYSKVSIKVKDPSDNRSVTAAMDVVGFHADGGTPASGASPEKENEHICRIS